MISFDKLLTLSIDLNIGIQRSLITIVGKNYIRKWFLTFNVS